MPLSKDDVKQIWNEVNANRDRLQSCPRHTFQMLPNSMQRMKFNCTHCKGELRTDAMLQYVAGYMAAGGNPLDVAPWFMDQLTPEEKAYHAQQRANVEASLKGEGNESG